MIDISSIRQDEKNNRIMLLSTVFFIVAIMSLKTFMSSAILEFILLIISLGTLIFYYVKNKESISIYKFEIMWMIFYTYFILNILIQAQFMKVHLFDLFISTFILSMFLLYKVTNVRYILVAFKIILMVSIFYGLSAIFQYMFTDVYSQYILHRFNDNQIKEILRLLGRGNYTGFTSQTAYLAGFLVYGIGILFILYRKIDHKIYRLLFIVAFLLLMYSLFLSGKRAHLLFMFISLLVVYLFSTEPKKFFNRFIKVIIGLGSFLIVMMVTLKNYTPKSNGQIGKVYLLAQKSFEGLLSGKDVSNGRMELYQHALVLLNNSPILGIGWRGFYQSSLGVINSNKFSHPHNIYIQLLTELGVVGFLLFIVPVIYIFIKTIGLLMNLSDHEWKSALQFSLYLQSFFLLYGMTGNVLTDHIFLLMYVFGITIVLSYAKYIHMNPVIRINIFNKFNNKYYTFKP